MAIGQDMTDTHQDTRCRHCARPLRDHGGRENPHRAYACPGKKEPRWPKIQDERSAGELFDRRLAKFWAERSTSFSA